MIYFPRPSKTGDVQKLSTGLSMDVEDFPYRPDFLQSHASHVIVYHKLVDLSRFNRPPKTQMSKVVFLTQGPWLILGHA